MRSKLKGRLAASVALLALCGAAWGHGESQHRSSTKKQPQALEEKAFGNAGIAAKVTRTFSIGMDDTMHFAADAEKQRDRVRLASVNKKTADDGVRASADITVKQGETVRFVVRNDGKIMHEMVIGTMKELKDHGELMRKHPGMEHDEPYMTHVAPGKRGEIVWQFTKAGEFFYACLIPGHMEAGMISKITVTPAK